MFCKRNLLPLVFGIVFLIACQKENTISPPAAPHPYAHLEGEFYTERLHSGSYAIAATNNTGRWIDTADAFIACGIEGDSLELLGFYFALDSLTQTRFYYNDGVGGYIEVNFADSYDSIYIKQQYGNYGSFSYKGRRGTNSHRHIGALYNLWVEHKRIATGIDTQYRKNIMVDYSYQHFNQFNPYAGTMSFSLDGESYSFRGFESRASEFEEIIYNNRKLASQNIYWKNDSFYLEQYITTYPISTPVPPDTIYWLYKGRKL